MCVVSMVMDHYSDKWGQKVFPNTLPSTAPFNFQPSIFSAPVISPEEIKEFRELLERAREYDRRNNEPECELQSKKNKILELAKELGIADQVTFI